MRPTSLPLALLLVCAAVGRASASPLLETVGPVGDNAGVQGVVSGPGAASTYFNPAMLTEADEEFLVGWAVAAEQIGVTLDGRRSAGDVPITAGGRDIIGSDGQPIPNDSVPTKWLEDGCPPGARAGECPAPGFNARPRQARGSSRKTRTYLTLGIVKHLISDRFTLGVYAMLPLSSFLSARGFYPDEREALFSNSLHPELYGDRMSAVSISAGAGFKLRKDISLGIGLSLALANTVTSSTYVRDSTDYNKLLLDNSVSTQVNVSPTFGVRWQPASAVRFGGAVRAPSSFKLDAGITATLPSGTESGTTRSEVYDYVPWRVAFGAEVDVIHRADYTLTLVGSVNYAFWSTYEDRHGQRPNEVYGEAFGWSDTLSGALGVRHKVGRVRGFMDLSFVPSPVPAQTGRSNYVDNDKLGMALGGDIEFQVAGTAIRPGLSLFAQRLVPRHVTKDDALLRDEVPDDAVFGSTREPVPGAAGLQTNNPGWPGFASAGYLYGGTVTLSIPL